MTLSLHESAAVVGGHCWTERRLFELLGSWVAPTASAEAKLLLDRHSQHAAWRAQQWWDRLPVLASVDRDELVVAPGPWAEAMADGPAGDVARLALAYRVLLPRLVARYRHHGRTTAPVADAPVIRTLGQVEADLRADWADGELLLQGLVGSDADARAAGESVVAAERLFLG